MRQCDSYSTSMQMRCCYAEGHSGEHHFSNHDETDRIRWKIAVDERNRLAAENDSLRAEVERLRAAVSAHDEALRYLAYWKGDDQHHSNAEEIAVGNMVIGEGGEAIGKDGGNG